MQQECERSREHLVLCVNESFEIGLKGPTILDKKVNPRLMYYQEGVK